MERESEAVPTSITFGRRFTVETLAFNPDSQTITIGIGQGIEHPPVNGDQLWDISSDALLARMSHEQQIKAVAFSHDGRWLATGGADSLVHVWGLRTYR
ncbi:MAG: hypothetical protein SWK90_12955 [Chloroflexota bacterium]|nr:hypothetical protein [Chloroflexota bacterium]